MTTTTDHPAAPAAATTTRPIDEPQEAIKVVAWDLDGVVFLGQRPADLPLDQWNSLLASPTDAALWQDLIGVNLDVIAEMHRLNSLGILQTVISRNEEGVVRPLLEALGVWQYFLYPQTYLDFETGKSVWLRQTIADLNLHLDTALFIDDQLIELDEVDQNCRADGPVEVAHINDIQKALHGPRFPTGTPTPEARNRPAVYRARQRHNDDRRTHLDGGGTHEAWLATTESEVTIWPASSADLDRLEELGQRTHQWNNSGIAYTVAELNNFRESPGHLLLVASLTDKYVREVDGGYGIVGMGLASLHEGYDHLRLVLASCKVETRNIGGLLITEFTRRAMLAGKTELRADYIEIDGGRNNKMHRAFRLAKFERVPDDDPRLADTTLDLPDGRRLRVYSRDLSALAQPPDYPTWLKVEARP